MTKIGLSTEDKKASARQYLKDNREAWKSLGVRPLTAGVPDPVRDVVLAELEVHKFMHLAEMAENEDTDVNTLDEIARRNMIRMPTDDQIDEVDGMLVDNKQRKVAAAFLSQYTHYRKKYNGIRSQYDPDMEYSKRKRAEARGVSYSNLACAYFRLAAVVLDSSGKVSVFGQHDNPLVGD